MITFSKVLVPQKKVSSSALEAGARSPLTLQTQHEGPSAPGYLSWLYLLHPLDHPSQRPPHTREKSRENWEPSLPKVQQKNVFLSCPPLPRSCPSAQPRGPGLPLPPWPHLHLHEPPQVRAVVGQVDLAQCLHVLVPDLLCGGPFVAQQELIEKPGDARDQSVSLTAQDAQHHAGLLKGSEATPSPSFGRQPVLQQGCLGDLIVGHWFSEGIDLLKDELSDLRHCLDMGDQTQGMKLQPHCLGITEGRNKCWIWKEEE